MNRFLRADAWHFFFVKHLVHLLLSHLIESANGDHRSPSKTTFQLNSGTKSDKEKSEGKDEAPSRVCSWGLPAECPKHRRSEPCRGIKALRAAITLTTRREVPRTGSIFRDFFHGTAIGVYNGDARRQNLVHFAQTTKKYMFKKIWLNVTSIFWKSFNFFDFSSNIDYLLTISDWYFRKAHELLKSILTFLKLIISYLNFYIDFNFYRELI